MENFKLKRLMSLGLSIFALSLGSVGLVGCEVEPQGDAEEVGEDIDEGVEDINEGVEDAKEEAE